MLSGPFQAISARVYRAGSSGIRAGAGGTGTGRARAAAALLYPESAEYLLHAALAAFRAVVFFPVVRGLQDLDHVAAVSAAVFIDRHISLSFFGLIPILV